MPKSLNSVHVFEFIHFALCKKKKRKKNKERMKERKKFIEMQKIDFYIFSTNTHLQMLILKNILRLMVLIQPIQIQPPNEEVMNSI